MNLIFDLDKVTRLVEATIDQRLENVQLSIGHCGHHQRLLDLLLLPKMSVGHCFANEKDIIKYC